MRRAYNILVGNSIGKDHSRDLGERRKGAILKWKMECKGGLDSTDSGMGILADCCEHGNKLPSSIKVGSILISLGTEYVNFQRPESWH
jgi:hypothetical protein